MKSDIKTPSIAIIFTSSLKHFWTIFVNTLMKYLKSMSLPIGPFRIWDLLQENKGFRLILILKKKSKSSQYFDSNPTCDRAGRVRVESRIDTDSYF